MIDLHPNEKTGKIKKILLKKNRKNKLAIFVKNGSATQNKKHVYGHSSDKRVLQISSIVSKQILLVALVQSINSPENWLVVIFLCILNLQFQFIF